MRTQINGYIVADEDAWIYRFFGYQVCSPQDVRQALADGAFALALGLPLHLGVPPFITGSKLVTKVLTEDMVGLTGGRVIVDGDGKSAANTLEAIIEEKRKALNI